MSAHPNLPARRPRHDGWTVERQAAFLKALSECGCVTDAARSVGMTRQSAHNLYNRPSAGAFRRAYDAALDCSLRLVEDGMWSRAVKGVPRPIFYQGEQVGEYRHFDERLTMFLLRYRRPHRYYQKSTIAPVVHPPGWDDDAPDPDEAIGGLDFHLEDLADEEDGPPSLDGVNFVNFVGDKEELGNALAPLPAQQREREGPEAPALGG
ncbi:hypothetical protein [Sphingomonas sp.]|uniref:hypothetical protein n=1 Tax=Sphingomonas sp. TaxID=28214 RepID=UPI0025F861B7|nr:hypothetical protein [Sphingomonas sp.]MBV9527477.1 hypothetical protein [Sphingomonas sp.]